MAIDRRLKKKKKREQKQKERRRQKERENRIERSGEYIYLASLAYDEKDYQQAYQYAMKRLKVRPKDLEAFAIAIDSALQLEDAQTHFDILCWGWDNQLLLFTDDYFNLAYLAYKRDDYALSEKVYRALYNSEVQMDEPLTQKQKRDVKSYINWFENQRMYQVSELLRAEIQKQEMKQKTESKKKSKKQSQPKKKSLPVKTVETEKLLEPEISFRLNTEPAIAAIRENRIATQKDLKLALNGLQLSFRTSYDQLICLSSLRDVQSLWYQQETARKVMKNFRGRAILADEVGLGKTIEACLVLKEYLMRGLIKTVLILTPSSLVNQWQAELREKFNMDFVTSNDPLFREDPNRFWESPQLLVSINTAKSKRNFDTAIARSYDLVIVDEAHHLKNRRTLNWKLVNALQKTFLLLLTATPVENNLEELFNLVTLLVPGHLKTRKAFMDEFVSRANPTDPQNREKLRQLLREVMLRNTRSVTQVHLPPRFATTVKVSPAPDETAFYDMVNNFIYEQANTARPQISKHALQMLLTALGSSHLAALRMLKKMAESATGVTRTALKKLVQSGQKIKVTAKTERILELITANADKKLLFVNYIASLDYLHQILEEQGIPHIVFRGGMSADEKQAAVDLFREKYPLMLSTGIGGEGQNLQFCHTLINYDLPWNPMEIEQRIGRIHRIGQENDVQIYNFCAEKSLEEHILEVLDRKINMFELVIGEIDMILGRLRGEQEFSDMVYEIWVKNQETEPRQKAFNALGTRLKRAQNAYQKSKELDEKLFQEDFGV